MELERHTSPDGLLSLVVLREADDLIVGFEGGPSHTHGDVLIGEYASIGEELDTPDAAVRRYVSDILTNRIKIIVYRKDGAIRDVSAFPYDIPNIGQHLEPGETIEVRYWR
jgi:hypothetical protein